MRLSAIDIGWPIHVPLLARELDRLGYHRFWTTEHYAVGQTASPTVLAAVVAARTERLRIGPAGVMLSYQSPLKLAQDFFLLESLYPGRIDLGVVSARAQGSVARELMDGRTELTVSTFAEKADQLATYLQCRRTNGTDAAAYHIAYEHIGIPQLWVCGTTESSARLAARLGARYAFHHYLSQNYESAGIGKRPIDIYRQSFVGNASLGNPEFTVAAFGACAESDEEATTSWEHKTRPSFLGTPAQCYEQLSELQEYYGTNEVVIQCFGPTFQHRIAAYDMLAEVSGLVRSRRSGKRESAVVLKPHAVAWEKGNGDLQLALGREGFVLSGPSATVLKYLLSHPPIRVSKLIKVFEPEVDRDSLQDFLRDLVRSGIAEIVS